MSVLERGGDRKMEPIYVGSFLLDVPGIAKIVADLCFGVLDPQGDILFLLFEYADFDQQFGGAFFRLVLRKLPHPWANATMCC